MSTPSLFEVRAPVNRWQGLPSGATRNAFLDAVFVCREDTPASSDTIAALRSTIGRLAHQLIIPQLTDDQKDALSQPGDSDLDGFGGFLEPHLPSRVGQVKTDHRRPRVAAGTLVGTVWRGVPWKLVKIYLGQRNGRVFFCHTRPAVIYDVAVEDVVQCEALKGRLMQLELAPELQDFARNIWPKDIEARQHPSLDFAYGLILTEIIDTARALPSRSAPNPSRRERHM